MAFSSTPLPTQPNAAVDWGRGVATKTQQAPFFREPPPTKTSTRRPMPIQQGSFGTAQMMNQTEAQIIQNVVNNDFLKSIPKGTAKVASSVLSMMLPDMSKTGAECPKQHVKRVMTNILKRYDQVVHVQNPQGLSAKAGEFVGEMFAFGAVGKVVRVAEGVSIFASACEGGLYGALLSETHDTNRVAGIAFGFVGGGATTRVLFKGDVPRPLLDRVFARSQGPSRQLPDFQRPTYHSGIGSPWAEMVPTHQVQRNTTAAEKAVTKLAERNVSKIKSSKDVYAPDRKLPRDVRTKEPVPDIGGKGVHHTQLGTKESSKTGKKYVQAREFDADGNAIKDIHFTDHGKPQNYPNPHQHVFNENPTGGTKKRGDPEQLSTWSYK